MQTREMFLNGVGEIKLYRIAAINSVDQSGIGQEGNEQLPHLISVELLELSELP